MLQTTARSLRARLLPALPVLALAAGCNIGKVSRVLVLPPNPGSATSACRLLSQGGQACRMDQPLEIRVYGRGPCTLLEVEFGDGQKTEVRNADLARSEEDGQSPLMLPHSYRGLPGPKQIRAKGVTNCADTAASDFDLLLPDGRAAYVLGLQQPVPTACTPVPSIGPLRAGTVVRVTTTDVQTTNYGCPFGGCVYGPDGKPGSSAAEPFPFPGMREFSQVWRIGTQIEQGGASATFTVRQAGPLEVCVNDHVLADNRGAWRVDISADERNAR